MDSFCFRFIMPASEKYILDNDKAAERLYN